MGCSYASAYEFCSDADPSNYVYIRRPVTRNKGYYMYTAYTDLSVADMVRSGFRPIGSEYYPWSLGEFDDSLLSGLAWRVMAYLAPQAYPERAGRMIQKYIDGEVTYTQSKHVENDGWEGYPIRPLMEEV